MDKGSGTLQIGQSLSSAILQLRLKGGQQSLSSDNVAAVHSLMSVFFVNH